MGRADASDAAAAMSNKRRNGWFYIRALLEIGKGLSLEELQKMVGPPVGREEQLLQLRQLLDSGFEKALAKLHRETA